VAQSNLHSYILLIPFISSYLLYIRRRQLPRDFVPSYGLSLVSLVIGLSALTVALRATPPLTQNDYLGLVAFSFVCFLATGGFFFLGGKWMAAAAFPLAFLLFIVPLPDAAADFLRNASKTASAEAASLFFSISGTPVFRDGTVFQLPNIVIEVSEECSGIRSSWILLITSLLAANLFLKSPWQRLLLVAVVIPLGIVRNGFRILVIGLLCIHVGPQMIHSIIHHQGGPLFFALSLIPLFLLMWWMRRKETFSGRPKRATPERMKAD
jgi:exosortase C (VPDSG-CTERM-specific)